MVREDRMSGLAQRFELRQLEESDPSHSRFIAGRSAAAGIIAVGYSVSSAAGIVSENFDVAIAPGSSYTFGFEGGGQFNLYNFVGSESYYTGILGPVNNACGADPYGAALTCQYDTTVAAPYYEAYAQGTYTASQYLGTTGSSFVSAGTAIGAYNTANGGYAFAYAYPNSSYGTVGTYQTYSGPYSYSCGKNCSGSYYQHINNTAYGDILGSGYQNYGTTGQNLFLPLAAAEGSTTLYGWAEISLSGGNVGTSTPYAMTLDAIAYDTTGATIDAGETAAVPVPPTLALLASGVGALGIFRRRKSREASGT